MEKNGFFEVACQDLARIVSILSLESTDVSKPRKMNSFWTNCYEKLIFFCRFFYLVFYKGFTPTIFDLLPFPIWYGLTFAVYLYRATILPFLLRLSGYGKYADWNIPQLGSSQPDSQSLQMKPINPPSLVVETRLKDSNFGDPEFEKLLQTLYLKKTHLSPHSQSPGHPLVAGFPGNFMNHLIGVYKALLVLAWHQPQYVVRGGFFHSVYGTFDYRAGCYDLKDGRQQLIDLIGPGAEELAFCICTSDRLGMIQDLNFAMYGMKTIPLTSKTDGDDDGNSLPPLLSRLTSDGFRVRNHITQKYHVFPPHLFAQFIVVVCADFMEQGALPGGARDMDLCLFRFLRYRYFNDLLRYVSPFLYVIPPVFKKYLWTNSFQEPTREELQMIMSLWGPLVMNEACDSVYHLTLHEKNLLVRMVEKYPYLIESHVVLACGLEDGEDVEGYNRRDLCRKSLRLIEEWGMLSYKKASMKDVLKKIHGILEEE